MSVRGEVGKPGSMDQVRFELLFDKYRWATGRYLRLSAQHMQRQAQLRHLPRGNGHTDLEGMIVCIGESGHEVKKADEGQTEKCIL